MTACGPISRKPISNRRFANSRAATGDSARPAPDVLKPELAQRILSALVLAPPVLAAIWLGGPWFAVLIALAAGILAWEWGRMTGIAVAAGRSGEIGLGVAIVAPVVLAVAGMPLWALAALVPATVAGALVAGASRRLWGACGALYIGLPLIAVVWLRGDPTFGRATVLWVVAVVWAADIGAYGAGRLIGGPKLAPAISPNKTWAGLAGAVAAAALVGAVAAGIVGRGGVEVLALASAGLGLVSQGGDLLESSMKRHFKVKDSSNLIPGHGGLLDRVDALLAAVAAVAVLNLAGTQFGHVLTWS